MEEKKYAIHPELKELQNYQLPSFFLTRFGSNLYNLVSTLSFYRLKIREGMIRHTHRIKGYQQKSISLYSYEPDTMLTNSPAIVYYHGGGFALKGSKFHHQLCMNYAYDASCKVFYVDYRTSSNHLFPTSLEDAYHGAKWVYDHATVLGIDRKNIILMGDSAGGALAACVDQMLRDRDVFRPKAQVLFYPVTDERQVTDSCKDFTDTPIWTTKLNYLMWRLYLRSTDLTEQNYAAPLMHDDLTSLAPAYIEVCEFDPLKDEGMLYGQALKHASNEVFMKEVKGAFHGFDVLIDKAYVKNLYAERIEQIKAFFAREY